jgi:DNA mismatch endonuclease, patch repair protein
MCQPKFSTTEVHAVGIDLFSTLPHDSLAMADIYSKARRSEIMAAIRSRGNKATEVALAQVLRRNRLWGWRRHVSLVGKPDFAFPKKRVAVFVDGCFWHGCPTHFKAPKSNRNFWVTKIRTNKIRDRLAVRLLKEQGWTVVRIWQHELKGKATSSLEKLARAFDASRKQPRMRRKFGR